MSAAAPVRTTVVFDLGGVVLHWEPAQLLLTHLPHRLPSEAQARGLAAEFFESFRPGGAWAEFDRGVLDTDAVADRIADRTGLSVDEVRSVMGGIPAHLRVRADTAGLLRELSRAGHRLVYLSNMPAAYIGHVQRELDGLGVFEQGIYSSDVQLVKPDPAIFTIAQQRFDCVPASCVFLDDNEANIVAARCHGWRATRFVDAAQAQRDLVAWSLLAA